MGLYSLNSDDSKEAYLRQARWYHPPPQDDPQGCTMPSIPLLSLPLLPFLLLMKYTNV